MHCVHKTISIKTQEKNNAFSTSLLLRLWSIGTLVLFLYSFSSCSPVALYRKTIPAIPSPLSQELRYGIAILHYQKIAPRIGGVEESIGIIRGGQIVQVLQDAREENSNDLWIQIQTNSSKGWVLSKNFSFTYSYLQAAQLAKVFRQKLWGNSRLILQHDVLIPNQENTTTQ